MGQRPARIAGLSPQLGLGAAGFAWRRRDDPRFFTASLRAATEGLDAELEERARPRASRAQEVRRPSVRRPSPSGPALPLRVQARLRSGVMSRLTLPCVRHAVGERTACSSLPPQTSEQPVPELVLNY